MSFGATAFGELPFATAVLPSINIGSSPGASQLALSFVAPTRTRTTNPAPGETPWRDEDPFTDGWTEESGAR